MKKTLTFLAVAIAATVFSVALKAQVDVTSLYLENTGFEAPPTTFSTSGVVTPVGTAFKNTSGYGYNVAGWTGELTNWARLYTVKYGLTFDFNSPAPTEETHGVMNGTNPPTQGPSNETVGTALAMSCAWSGAAVIKQTTKIPIAEGRYALVYKVYNKVAEAGSGTDVYRNRFGYIDEFGVTTYGTRISFEQNVWLSDTAWFDVIGEETGTVSMGFVGLNSGSPTQPRFFIDDIKLLQYPLDKTSYIDALNEVIAEAIIVLGADTGNEAADALAAAIVAAQNAVTNAASLATRVLVTQGNLLQRAILNYKIAQASEGNPLDMTVLIENPNFDDGGGLPWEYTTGATNHGTFTAETKTDWQDGEAYPNGHGTFVGNVWENWKGLADGKGFSGKMYQQLKALPNGKYKLTASAFASRTWEDAYPDEAEHNWFFLYGNSYKTPITTPRAMEIYEVICYVNDSTLQVGVEVTDSVTNWVGVDNFTLTYYGYDAVNQANYLSQILAEAGLLANDPMWSSRLTTLNDAIAQGNAAVSAATRAAIDAAVVALAHAIDSAKLSVADYARLAEALEVATAADYSTFPGYAAYQAAVQAVQNDYDGRGLNTEGVDADIAALKAAGIACQLTQAAPFDATFVIVNPSFENGLYSVGTKKNCPNGWQLEIASANNDFDTKLATVESFDGIYNYNAWSGQFKSIDLYQDVALPTGTYKLSAKLRSTATGVNGNQRIYVVADEVMTDYSDAYEFPWEVGDDADWETLAGWGLLSVNFEVTKPEFPVRIGATSTGDGTSVGGWFQADDFRLQMIAHGDAVNNFTVENTVLAYGVAGGIKITALENAQVDVYAITGQLLGSKNINGTGFIALPKGVYIVNHQKVVVR
jgi:hypothetical protein